VRIAALYDIHGNLPALEAVLEAVAREGPDLVVVGGDVAAGPMPAEVMDALTGAGVPLRWVMGNADREALAPADGDGPAEVVSRWAAARLSPDQRALIASFEPTVAVGGVLFCHGTPRSDIECLTVMTPYARLERLMQDVDEKVVVCGHTHRQFDLPLPRTRVVNAGSVGMPYEGEPGAFWALLEDGEVSLRRTDYDVQAAVERMRATGMPDVDELMLRESLLKPIDPDRVAAFFEYGDPL
jgi:putative phosphoesterase